MSSRFRYLMGIGIISSLTLIALTGFKWQFTKYLKAKQKWQIITNELKNDRPSNIIFTIKEDQLYPYKYIKITGSLSDSYVLVKRGKGGRLGHLVFRKIKLGEGEIAVLDGWIPEEYQFESVGDSHLTLRQYKGLLKSGEKKDYLNQKLNSEGKQKGMDFNTYINLDRILKQLNIQQTPINTKYYMELFENSGTKEILYPLRYTRNDFQMPYLTPERHMNYAMFWGGATLVGIWGVVKACKRR